MARRGLRINMSGAAGVVMAPAAFTGIFYYGITNQYF